MTIRKKFPNEFKLDAVRLIVAQGYRCAEAARSLGININMPGCRVRRRMDIPLRGYDIGPEPGN
ncbi:MAG: transposase [Gammaproteobacteria bacterium]|nr:transposase [Gammaproteobacteria bacterium]